MAIIILGIIFNWAIRNRMMSENPCRHIKLVPVGTRDTILEDADDYAKLFKALERLEAEHRVRQEAADAIRLIALTGCRRGEAAGLRWRHVERERIVLPPREHKAGRRTGKPRIIGLPAAAQAIIARQPKCARRRLRVRPSARRGRLQFTVAGVERRCAPRPVYRRSCRFMGCATQRRATWRWQVQRHRRSWPLSVTAS